MNDDYRITESDARRLNRLRGDVTMYEGELSRLARVKNLSRWDLEDWLLPLLEGRTLTEIRGMEDNSGEITLIADDGTTYRMYHEQDCCEAVWLEDVIGDVDDLIGTPILRAEVSTNYDEPPIGSVPDESYTWTFYRFTTIKGTVTLRWYGTSNGYYSENVTFQGGVFS